MDKRKPGPLDVECPTCLAQECFRCTTNWEFRPEYRRPTKPHAARVRAADLIEHLRDRLSEETDPNAPQRRALGTGAMRRAMPDSDEGGE